MSPGWFIFDLRLYTWGEQSHVQRERCYNLYGTAVKDGEICGAPPFEQQKIDGTPGVPTCVEQVYTNPGKEVISRP